jgi:hypothetical protein
MSNTQYRDLLITLGYSEDEAWIIVADISKFELELEELSHVDL